MEIAHLVSTHLQIVVTQLRLDVHDDPYRQPPTSVLSLLRSFAKARRAALSYVPGSSCLPFLEPFLSTIRCEETSGLVTQRALSSVLAILRADVLSRDDVTAGRAVADIVSAATNCRCEVTDTSSDEVVILGILQLLQGVAACEAGALLSDASVCEIVHACFRICSQPSLSELLRHSAEISLRSIVDSVFSRLAVLPDEGLMPPGSTEAAAAGAAAGDAAEVDHIHTRELHAHRRPADVGPVDAAEARADTAGPEAPKQLNPAVTPSSIPAATILDSADATAEAPKGHRTAKTSLGGGANSKTAANLAPASGTGGSDSTSGACDDPETGGEAGVNSSIGPYGGACLFEVLRFFLSLIDGTNTTVAKGPSVREFGLSLLLAAMRAGGPTLGRASPFSALLEDDVSLALIQSAEAEVRVANDGSGTVVGKESPALSLTLQCVTELLLILGLRGTAREEALLTRTYLKLLTTAGLPPLRLETTIEHLQHLVVLTELPPYLYLRFDCSPSREDLLEKLTGALRGIAAPVRPAASQISGGNAGGGAANGSGGMAGGGTAGGAAGGLPPPGWVGGAAYGRARELALEALLDLLSAVASLADNPQAEEGEVRDNADAAAHGYGNGEALASAATEALLAETLARKAHKGVVQAAAAEFSRKPSKGLDTLIKANLLPQDPTPAATAEVLRSMTAIDKAALGEFLSMPPDPNAKNPDFHKQLLEEWTAGFDFASYRLDQAMRVFLQSFRLPGEAQKIDRIMEALAHAFHRANPGPFAHPDATYVLAFSIIMLNTDLHSSKIAVEKKMSLESFCRQAEGINGTTDLPHSMLEEIYYAIKGDEIRMLGGGEETTLSRAGWKHLGDADAKGPDAVALQGRSSPGLGARAGGATTVGTSATACVHQAADDAALEHAMLHSRGLGGHILTHVCWAPTMGALGSAARTAAARAESDNARRRAEAKQQLEVVHAGYALACRHAATHRLHAELDTLASHLARTSTLLQPPSTSPAAMTPAATSNAAPLTAGSTQRAPYHARLPARLAAAALCRLAREEGHALRVEGWTAFIGILLGLDARGMLPSSVLHSESSADPSASDATLLPPPPRRASPPPPPSPNKNASFSGWLSSSISALITGGADDDATADALAEAAAADEAERFAIEEVFRGSAHLPTEALLALATALSAAAGTAPVPSAAMPVTPARVPSPTPGRVAANADSVMKNAEPPCTPTAPPPPPPPGTPWSVNPACLATPHASTTIATCTSPAEASTCTAAAAAVVYSPALLRQLAVSVELLLGVVMRNRDRFEVLWPCVAPCVSAALAATSGPAPIPSHLASAAASASDHLLAAEHTTHALLRLARRLLHRSAAVESIALLLAEFPPGITSDAIVAIAPALPDAAADMRPVPPAVSLPKLSPRAAAAIGAELIGLLQAGGAAGLTSSDSWLALTRLAAGVAAAPILGSDESASRAGTEALASLLGHSVHGEGGCGTSSFSTLSALLLLNAHAAPSPSQCERAVGLLLQTHARLRASAQPAAAAGPTPAWRADWLRVLRGMCALCLDPRLASRDAALVAIQRALLDAELPPMPPSVWVEAFEHAVFPFLSELLRRWVASPEPEQERLMLRAVTLLSKTFLHHLSGLLTLPSFHLLWLRALELLESFMRAPDSENLAEAVPETLKNMLLVIGTSGAFEQTAKLGGSEQDLCQLTASIVGNMCPQLTKSPDLGWLWGTETNITTEAQASGTPTPTTMDDAPQASAKEAPPPVEECIGSTS